MKYGVKTRVGIGWGWTEWRSDDNKVPPLLQIAGLLWTSWNKTVSCFPHLPVCSPLPLGKTNYRWYNLLLLLTNSPRWPSLPFGSTPGYLCLALGRSPILLSTPGFHCLLRVCLSYNFSSAMALLHHGPDSTWGLLFQIWPPLLASSNDYLQEWQSGWSRSSFSMWPCYNWPVYEVVAWVGYSNVLGPVTHMSSHMVQNMSQGLGWGCGESCVWSCFLCTEV